MKNEFINAWARMINESTVDSILNEDIDPNDEMGLESPSWDEITKSIEDSLINKTKCKDDNHPDNPNVKIHDGKPETQGSDQGAKEIEKSKFYYGKEPRDIDEAVYFLWQIVKLYCGKLRMPKDTDCSDMYVMQYTCDARKMASMICGKILPYLLLDCGWSNNTTNRILHDCVEYMRQPKGDRDPSSLIDTLTSNNERYGNMKNSSRFKD